MFSYFLACGLTLIAPCSQLEASLQAATLTEAERKAGYRVVAVTSFPVLVGEQQQPAEQVPEIAEIVGFFDEI